MNDYLNLEQKIKKSKIGFGTKALIGTGLLAFGTYTLVKGIKKIIYPPTLKKYAAIAVAGLMIYSVTHCKTVTAGAIDLYGKHVKPAITHYLDAKEQKQPLQDKIKELSQNKAQLLDKYASKDDELRTKQQELDKLRAENTKLRTDYSRVKTDLDSIVKHKYELEDKVNNIEKKIDDKVNTLEKELKKKQESADKLQKDFYELKKKKDNVAKVNYSKKQAQPKKSSQLAKSILNTFVSPFKASAYMIKISCANMAAAAKGVPKYQGVYSRMNQNRGDYNATR